MLWHCGLYDGKDIPCHLSSKGSFQEKWTKKTGEGSGKRKFVMKTATKMKSVIMVIVSYSNEVAKLSQPVGAWQLVAGQLT